MRIIPFVLFYIWCLEKESNYYMLIFECCAGGLIVWEIICSRVALKVWSHSYEIGAGMLVNPNTFLGGIIYCVTCIFSSYYYMSQLPFNWLCGLIMLCRYIINSTAFIIFFMSINYSFTYSQWTLLYLGLYLLNIFSFLIWLFFKYHWLSSLVLEKGAEQQINQPLLMKEKEDQNENGYRCIYDDHRKSNKNNKGVIQMESFSHSHSQISSSLNEMHNIGVMGGYNPPRPMSNEASIQEFNDYQLAMKLQQEQLYKAAQGQRAKQIADEYVYGQQRQQQNDKKYQMHQQQIILDQQQRLIRRQIEKMNAMSMQQQQQQNDKYSQHTFEVQSDSDQQRIHKMYMEQQQAVLANSQKLKADGILDNNGDINDDIIKKLDTELLNKDDTFSISSSMLQEGNNGAQRASFDSLSDLALIIDAFDVNFNAFNPQQVKMSKKNLPSRGIFSYPINKAKVNKLGRGGCIF